MSKIQYMLDHVIQSLETANAIYFNNYLTFFSVGSQEFSINFLLLGEGVDPKIASPPHPHPISYSIPYIGQTRPPGHPKAKMLV
jgi:hypothetical protein